MLLLAPFLAALHWLLPEPPATFRFDAEHPQLFQLGAAQDGDHWIFAYFTEGLCLGADCEVKLSNFWVESTERPIIEIVDGRWVIHFKVGAP